MTTITHLDPEHVYELSRVYVTEVFPGDHDKRTSAVGFLNDDGTQLAQTVSNPDTWFGLTLVPIFYPGRLKHHGQKVRTRIP